jgi:hypothetical protein
VDRIPVHPPDTPRDVEMVCGGQALMASTAAAMSEDSRFRVPVCCLAPRKFRQQPRIELQSHRQRCARQLVHRQAAQAQAFGGGRDAMTLVTLPVLVDRP